ncbi:MAG: peptide deformylase [Bacteroidales bacterium]|nr:peptide deformylase [Bacteroidales bacterium]
MLLPIYLYGQAVLRKEAHEVPADYPDIKVLVENMFQTMEKANGVGLAAPQVGLDIRMFVVDGNGLESDFPECQGFRRCMINPEIIEESEETNIKDEGCLSVPGIYESVKRPNWIVIRYLDENFEEHEEKITGFAARMTLHEYDHLDGKMFIDRVSPLRKQLIKNKLSAILKGKVDVQYKYKGKKG